MRLSFSKMHGLGNDFAVFDLIRQRAAFSPERVRALADRKTGIGFDQLLLLEPPTDPSCDFLYRIYNADGGEVEHCGNGARCVARFFLDRGLGLSRRLKLQMAKGGSISAQVNKDGSVTVNMGPPRLEPAEIPFEAPARDISYQLALDPAQAPLDISAVSMGNPHAILLVEDAERAPVAELGPRIEAHPAFPRRVNAGFMQVLDSRRIRLRVFERGVGETLACGTGACAAVVAGRLRGLLEESVTVALNGGTLSISWKGDGAPVLMTGPATPVFDGQIDL